MIAIFSVKIFSLKIFFKQNIKMRRIPAIVCDIDGVIVRGKNIITGSDSVVRNIVGK